MNLVTKHGLFPLVALLLAVPAASSATNLVVNGSFELPVVQTNDPQLYGHDLDVGGWLVVGNVAGDVALLNGPFSQFGLTFSHQDGVQSIDLTGLTNVKTGIQQVLTTAPGTLYDLSFYVGNTIFPGSIWGQSSSIEVNIGGASFVATNADGPPGAFAWKRFEFQFQATDPQTELSFFNLDNAGDNVNQLDNVVVSIAAIPEPTTYALIGAGLLLTLAAGRRRRTE